MYDAIIVGARCAGAPTAMLLARKGYRVLLLDRASFPSDTISTHIIWPHGAAILDRWGLFDRLAATGCPPVARRMVFDVGPFELIGGVPDANGGRGGFCPRRTVLDKLLVDAAVEAGAELREGFSVEALVWDGDRVAGIKGAGPRGVAGEERARVVVGADGVHSFVAKAVDAPEYDTKPPLATYYYSYYSGFAADDVEQHFGEYQGVGCFPTHDGLTLMAAVWPSRRFEDIRADIAETRAEMDQTVLSRDSVNLVELAEDVVGHLGVLAEEKGQTLTIDATGAATAVADRVVLRQALINLVDNAIKFTPAGGRVSIRVATSNGTPLVDVSDTGPGIPRESQGLVFDRFYRGDEGGPAGSGLGLSIARRAVEANGGSLALAHSGPDGTTVRIVLPGRDS